MIAKSKTWIPAQISLKVSKWKGLFPKLKCGPARLGKISQGYYTQPGTTLTWGFLRLLILWKNPPSNLW